MGNGDKRTMFRQASKLGQTLLETRGDKRTKRRRRRRSGKINLNAPTCPCNVRSDDCVRGFPRADALYTVAGVHLERAKSVTPDK